MNDVTRRDVMKMAMAAGLVVAGGAAVGAQESQEAEAAGEQGVAKKEVDGYDGAAERAIVMSAGMTEDEAKCWDYAARAAGAFFDLPEMHPMDKQEVAQAIHVLQNKLLGRPTYRTYLEKAKAARSGR